MRESEKGFKVSKDAWVTCPCGNKEHFDIIDRRLDACQSGPEYRGIDPDGRVPRQVELWRSYQTMKETLRRMSAFLDRQAYGSNLTVFEPAMNELSRREAVLASEMLMNSHLYPKWESRLLGSVFGYMWAADAWQRAPDRDDYSQPIEDWSVFRQFTGASRRVLRKINKRHRPEWLRQAHRDDRVANAVANRLHKDHAKEMAKMQQAHDAEVRALKEQIRLIEKKWNDLDPLWKLATGDVDQESP